MRIVVSSLLVMSLLGCSMKDDTAPAKQNAEKENAAKPQGRNPGALTGMVLPDQEDSRPAGNANQNPPPQPAPAQANTIPEVEARLVEWPKAKQQNPNLEVVENKVTGGDPISIAASAYVSLSSKAESLNFQHQLNLLKEINEGNPPTFKQFTDLANQLRIKFQNQPAYRYYGYDSQTGGIVVLEDKAEKKRIYKEKGIPYED